MSGGRPRERQAAARARRLLSPLPLVLATSLAACGFNKPDLSYRDSRLHEPLAVPADLARPGYSPSMEIPAPDAAPAPDSSATPDGAEIELPPDLRSGSPDGGGE